MPNPKASIIAKILLNLDKRIQIILLACFLLFALTLDNKTIVFIFFTLFGAFVVYLISFYFQTIDIMPTLFLALLAARFFGPIEAIIYTFFAGFLPWLWGGGIYDAYPFVATVNISTVSFIAAFFGFIPFLPYAIIFTIIYTALSFVVHTFIYGSTRYAIGAVGVGFFALLAYTLAFGPMFSKFLLAIL